MVLVGCCYLTKRNLIVIKRQCYLAVARQNVMVRNVAVSNRKRHPVKCYYTSTITEPKKFQK
jgi:hypothetical protein